MTMLDEASCVLPIALPLERAEDSNVQRPYEISLLRAGTKRRPSSASVPGCHESETSTMSRCMMCALRQEASIRRRFRSWKLRSHSSQMT
jgi:hypothetical protein